MKPAHPNLRPLDLPVVAQEVVRDLAEGGPVPAGEVTLVYHVNHLQEWRCHEIRMVW